MNSLVTITAVVLIIFSRGPASPQIMLDQVVEADKEMVVVDFLLVQDGAGVGGPLGSDGGSGGHPSNPVPRWRWWWIWWYKCSCIWTKEASRVRCSWWTWYSGHWWWIFIKSCWWWLLVVVQVVKVLLSVTRGATPIFRFFPSRQRCRRYSRFLFPKKSRQWKMVL